MELPAFRSIPRFVWIVPAVLLAVAVARLPYGYYTFTRVVTSGAAILIAIAGFEERLPNRGWSVLFVLTAVLFNPLIPIHLDRATWFYLDLGAAAVFVAHLLLVRVILS